MCGKTRPHQGPATLIAMNLELGKMWTSTVMTVMAMGIAMTDKITRAAIIGKARARLVYRTMTLRGHRTCLLQTFLAELYAYARVSTSGMQNHAEIQVHQQQ